MPLVTRQQPTLSAQPGFFNANASSMRKWIAARAKVRAGTGRAKLFGMGDSKTDGAGAGSSGAGSTKLTGAFPKGYMSCLATLLSNAGLTSSCKSIIGDGGVTSDTGMTLPVFDARNAFGAGWASSATFVGMGGKLIRYVNGSVNSWAFTPVGSVDTAVIYYYRNNALGQFKINVDGGAALATVDCNGAGAVLSQTVTFSAGSHTINLEGQNNGTVYILGIYAYLSTSYAVDVLQCAQWGGLIANMVDTTAQYSWFNAMDVITADAYFLKMTTNDLASSTNVQYWHDRNDEIVAKLSGYGSVMLVIDSLSSSTDTSLMNAYYETAKGIALSRNCAVACVPDRWGSYANSNSMGFKDADTIHDTAPGYYDLAQFLSIPLLTV